MEVSNRIRNTINENQEQQRAELVPWRNIEMYGNFRQIMNLKNNLLGLIFNKQFKP